MLLVSQGVPMLLMGDECGRTQLGNNNAYCHDGPLTWFDWGLVEANADLHRFSRLMIKCRCDHPALRSPLHGGADGSELLWHGAQAYRPDWSVTSRVLAFERRQADASGTRSIYVAMNMHGEALHLGLPSPPEGARWHVVANTGMPSPEDIWEYGAEPLISNQEAFLLGDRSIAILVAKKSDSPPFVEHVIAEFLARRKTAEKASKP
jgi:glycogen operon protein